MAKCYNSVKIRLVGYFFQQVASTRAVTSAVGNRLRHLKSEAAGVFSQKGTAFAGAGHDLLWFLAAGDFEDEGAVEMDLDQFAEEGSPVDATIARRAVFIRVAAVVVHMEHAQIGRELVNEVVEFT